MPDDDLSTSFPSREIHQQYHRSHISSPNLYSAWRLSSSDAFNSAPFTAANKSQNISPCSESPLGNKRKINMALLTVSEPQINQYYTVHQRLVHRAKDIIKNTIK
jgi:hypothetical protein